MTAPPNVRRALAKAPWTSGWCGHDNPPESHKRCPGVQVKGSGKPCACGCHKDHDAGVNTDSATPFPASAADDAPTEAKGASVPALAPTLASGIKPGLHFDLPNDDYHALTDWYSSTQLKRALPERYKDGGSQEALDFGTLVHAVVLEPANLGHYVMLDPAAIAGNNPKTGKPYDAPQMTARFKAAKAEAEQDGHTVVSQEDWDTAHRMREAILGHDVASELLFGDMDGVCEESAFVTDEHGIRHKARFDKRIPGTVIDLKTTASKPGADAIGRNIVDYGYDLSAAHYMAVCELLELDVQGFVWVFVDKSDQHRVSVVAASNDWLERGRILREQAIRRLTDPAEPAYDGATGYLEVPVPGWARLTDTPAGIPADFEWKLDDYS